MSTAASELELVLVRFEPHQILFCDKRTKELYEYYPAANLDYRPDLQHEFLLRGLLFNEGLLYPKEASTLHTEMLMRSRTGQCLHTEEQLMNTFLPLFICLNYLHSQETIHGKISPALIVICKDERIKLKDWLIASKTNRYYFGKQAAEISKQDDVRALAYIFTLCLLAKSPEQMIATEEVEAMLANVLKSFSKNIIYILIWALKGYPMEGDIIVKLLSNSSQTNVPKEIQGIYQRLLNEPSLKKTPPLCEENQYKTMTRIVFKCSPAKKFAITSASKKFIRFENGENRVDIKPHMQKRQVENLNVVVAKKSSNAEQLMLTKGNKIEIKQSKGELRGRTQIKLTNFSILNIENTNGKQLRSQLPSPKRIKRGVSKK